MTDPQKIASFQKKILGWYDIHHRDLPWRRTRDPYRILISEVMSQQTQLSRVVPKYESWLDKFPTIENLANAKISEVLFYWSGLGYNRRALNLKKTAEIISTTYHGTFPQTEKALLALPGIGKYTARAILCFAFNKQIAVVDTNVRKVLLIQFDASENNIVQAAQMLLPIGKAYEWNQALMDYAAAVLKKEKIPFPKQSKFIGSHRYYRGQVLKHLVQKRKIKVEELGFVVKKDYSHKEKAWLQSLLNELAGEGFITVKNNFIMLAT